MLHVLFVCTGNTCRSPMAKAIYAEKSVEYGISSICSSAALGFGEGVVSPNSVEVCREIGIDISDHRPRVIRERDIAITDVFVVMTEMHAQTLMGMLGVPMSKIYIAHMYIFLNSVISKPAFKIQLGYELRAIKIYRQAV